MREMARGRPQPLQVRRGVAVRAKEVAAHIVVDPMHLPAEAVEERNRLRTDEAAASRGQADFHGVSYRSVLSHELLVQREMRPAHPVKRELRLDSLESGTRKPVPQFCI